MLDELRFLGASLLLQIAFVGTLVGLALFAGFFGDRYWPSRPLFIKDNEHLMALGLITLVIVLVL